MLSDRLHAWVVNLSTWLAFGLLLMLFVLTLTAAVLWFQDRYLQKSHAIRRNYPLIGRFRYFFEHLGEFFRQYFFAMDREELPFNRAQRSWVYRAAKDLSNTVAFGTTKQNTPGRVIFLNTPYPTLEKDAAQTLPLMVGPHARQPYVARSFHNISGMSFGALSRPAVRALSRGAGHAGCWLNTGEGGLTEMHLEGGGDVVFQIGTAYYGVRDADGELSDARLEEVAALPQVKMFEIKLSQGAKPGKGGILPAEKVTPEIARIRGIPVGQPSVSPNGQPGVRCAEDLLDLIARVRDVTGKPTGIKTVIGSWQWLEDLFVAIHERGLDSAPDFITVDSGEGGTGAAPMSLMDDVGLNLAESLPLVVDLRDGFGLQERIRVIASGKLINPTMVAWAIAMGADFCVSARGYMFALGCIQAMQCNRNTCPTGVTTHNPRLQRGLVPAEKGRRVAHFHANLVKEVETIAHACGVGEPRQLRRHHARMVNANGDSMPLEELWPPIEPGLYLRQGRPSLHAPLARFRVGT
ncbi:FMN-binding glutamate synthase family protein [Alloalcanivorax gelatiniphagus]|uniref:FMN-binding glutamate synthase family protein n=1 Tax=Alloalcanivorax gelatiniphagus TaxID=1194167 RepID=A0ABY2XP99_9GAMM|nr:FMN-binding glutamate synthase family protein [Alloalcanivorax gelatiniphagus]TMW13845.1 FMN-binding glutamate synthase family protein [Alloalcanivorax gelatiniphagus]|tara:strand:+ start:1949 stop:3514 length:1566 start_codon:yes stop_codon:yes gene_type:complete